MSLAPPQISGEFTRIARYFAPLAAGAAAARGLTDDAAFLEWPAGEVLVITQDAVVAGVHFVGDESPADIARKALRVNLSDLAAKGAVPVAYLLTLALPHGSSDQFVAGFAAGLAADQALYGLDLIGGDTVSTPGPLTLSITALGRCARPVERRGAQVGDLVCVTGTIGDARLGLDVALGRDLSLDGLDRAFVLNRYRLPEPRLAFGAAMVGLVHAAQDVSDGLLADLGHLAAASAVSIEIEAAALPLSPAAGAVLSRTPTRLADLLGGGDDYEIVLTVSEGAWPRLAEVASASGTKLTVIGRVVPALAGAVRVRDADGAEVVLPQPGWQHS